MLGLPDADATPPGGNGEIVFMRYITNETPPYYQLVSVEPDGSHLHVLTNGAFPSFFAAGSKLAYLGYGDGLMYVADPDGSNAHVSEATYGMYITASPDGTAFA